MSLLNAFKDGFVLVFLIEEKEHLINKCEAHLLYYLALLLVVKIYNVNIVN